MARLHGLTLHCHVEVLAVKTLVIVAAPPTNHISQRVLELLPKLHRKGQGQQLGTAACRRSNILRREYWQCKLNAEVDRQ